MTQSERWYVMGFVVISAVLIWLLAPVLTPFAISALLAYMSDPLADFLQRKGLGRNSSVSLVFLVMLLVLLLVTLLLIPLLESQIKILIGKMPVISLWIREKLALVLQHYELGEEHAPDLQKVSEMLKSNWKEAGGLLASFMTSLTKSGLTLLNLVMNLVLVPVVTFYLLRDWDILMKRIRQLLPRRMEPVISQLASESDDVLGAFVRGQLAVMVVLGLFFSIGLWLAGIDFAFLIGMTAGMVSFVPYLGGIIGIVSALLAAWFQYQDGLHLVYVIVVFGVGQVLQDVVLVPRFVGDRIGMHPVAVIFAVLAGGQLFGFFGVLVALPAAAVIVVLLRHANSSYLDSRFYRQGGECPAEESNE